MNSKGRSEQGSSRCNPETDYWHWSYCSGGNDPVNFRFRQLRALLQEQTWHESTQPSPDTLRFDVTVRTRHRIPHLRRKLSDICLQS